MTGSSTIGDLIERATERLRAAGVTKPRREAHRLWAWGHRDRGIEREQAAAFDAAVERRVRGEPLAYVLGHTGFRRLVIQCDGRALIPRPETEGLVELALVRVQSGRALDLGTGTGCVALALADEGRFTEVVAVDRSASALELAALNAAATGLGIRLVRADLAKGFRPGCFDLVVSNPPYITTGEIGDLDPSVRDWEPGLALDGGPDGMALIGQVIRDAAALLVPGGWLVVEVDSTRSEQAASLARAAGWDAVEIHPDLYGRDRYLTARFGNERGGRA